MANPKDEIMDQVRQEAALQNARLLMEKLNEHCFERCVPKPGSSLSSSESTCFTACMEKYIASWSTVANQYMGHVQKGVGSGQSFGGL